MANLKDTVVLGKLNVTDQVIADKIIKLGGTANEVLCADGTTKTLSGLGAGTVTSVTVEGNNGLTGTGTITTSGTITLSHADTSSQASMTTGGRTYVNSITLDGYGHVTAIGTGTETNQDLGNYVTLNGGQTITGAKTFSGGLTIQGSGSLMIDGTLVDGDDLSGTEGQLLSATESGVKWVAPPIFYLSPGQFNIATENYIVTDSTAQSQIEDNNCFCIIVSIIASDDVLSGTVYLYKSGICDNLIWFQDAKVHWREANSHPNYLTELRYNTTQHKFMWTRSA